MPHAAHDRACRFDLTIACSSLLFDGMRRIALPAMCVCSEKLSHMIGRIFTVGGFTLLSRITGFFRDMMLAAILGAGPVADAFFVALRLPNHFRAIFAEGAFNAAFVPAYARIREQGGPEPARLFADRIFTLLFASQVVLLAIALVFTPGVISAAGAGLQQRSRPLRARGRADPHHLSVSVADHAGHALWRHPQCHRPFRRGRGGADPAQPVDDGGVGLGGVLSDRRACRGLGRADRGRSGSVVADGRCRRGRACWRTFRKPVLRRRLEEIFPRARPGDDRLGRNAARAVRRHGDRELPRHRRAVGALLCRPHQSIADRRDRDRHWHRAAAGNGAPDRRRRRSRRAVMRRTAPSS